MNDNQEYQKLQKQKHDFYLNFMKNYSKMQKNIEFKCRTLANKDEHSFVPCYRRDKKALDTEYMDYQAEMAFEDLKAKDCQKVALESNKREEYIKCQKAELEGRTQSYQLFSKKAS